MLEKTQKKLHDRMVRVAKKQGNTVGTVRTTKEQQKRNLVVGKIIGVFVRKVRAAQRHKKTDGSKHIFKGQACAPA